MDYNITYRERNNSIQVVISYKDHNGKWKQKSKQGFKTQREAKRVAEKIVGELKEEFKHQLSAEYQDITFKEYADIYMSHNAPYLEANTALSIELAVNRFEKLHDMELKDVTYKDIQDCINGLLKENVGASSIQLYYSNIKKLFRKAIKPYKIIRETPCHDIMLPKIVKNDKFKALSKGELETLLSKLSNKKYRMVALLASNCGLRLGEIMGLTLTDIDFINNEIHINKQWKLLKSEGNDRYGFGPTKTANSVRKVPMPKNVATELKKYISSQPIRLDKRIIDNKNNASFTSVFGNKLRKLGYDNSLHDLRHTYVTLLIAQGIDFKTISDFIGDRVEMVYKVYGHVNNDMRKNAADKIDDIFG